MRLSNKTALVTAADQGIGRASAIAMAREGAQVLATDFEPRLAGVAQRHSQYHHTKSEDYPDVQSNRAIER